LILLLEKLNYHILYLTLY